MLPMDWSNKVKHASSSIVAHDPESVSAEYGQHFPAEKSSSEPLEASSEPLAACKAVRRTARSSPNCQSPDSSASMLTDVYPAQPRNAAILAIALQSSYLLLTPSAKTKQRRRWRPTKLITACTTPRAPLPNMDSLFQPRKSHRQNIARSILHDLSNPFRLVRVEPPCTRGPHRQIPRRKTLDTSYLEKVTSPSEADARGPFLAQPTSYNQPPRAPA